MYRFSLDRGWAEFEIQSLSRKLFYLDQKMYLGQREKAS